MLAPAWRCWVWRLEPRTAGAYPRGDALKRREALMTAWEEYCLSTVLYWLYDSIIRGNDPSVTQAPPFA